MKSGAWLVAAMLIVSAPALAEHRLAIEPSLDVIEVHDDNLNFSADEPVRDRIRRITPTLAVRFDSPRWRVRGVYSIDSEHYMNQSTLNSDRARARGLVGIQYQAGPRLTLAMNSAYVDTNTLADLNVDTGLAASRVRGRRLSFDPSVTFRISPRLTATAATSSVTTNVINGVGMRTQSETLGLGRRVTWRDLFSVDYQHSHLVFIGANAQTTNSHSVLVGWTRDFGLHDRFIVQAGPRITNQSRSADLSASLTHTWKRTSIGLSLLRNQTTVVGYAGAADTESLQARFTVAPNRRLSAYTEPAIIRSTNHQLEATVYRVALGARCAITSLVNADVAYNRVIQNGAIDPLRPNAKLSRSTLSIGFTTHWNNPERTR